MRLSGLGCWLKPPGLGQQLPRAWWALTPTLCDNFLGCAWWLVLALVTTGLTGLP